MSSPTRRSRPARRGLALASLLAGGWLLASCSGSTDPTPAPGQLAVVANAALQFTPSTLTVHTGDDVTFVFGAVAHNVFFDGTAGAPTDIPGNNANVSADRTFNTAGTFHYTCHIHPGMAGTVVVTP
jgi:plastocyanin